MEGFSTPKIENKWSLRASDTGELVFDNVKVPKENLLPNVSGLKGPLWDVWIKHVMVLPGEQLE